MNTLLRSALFLLTFLLMQPLLAQQKDSLIRYFDASLRESLPARAADTVMTIRSREADGSLLEEDFYLSNRQLKRSMRFTDTSRKYPNGPYLMFYRDGTRRAVGLYERGQKRGTWKSWSREGSLTDSVVFNNKGNMTGTRILFNGVWVRDSIVYAADGSGKSINYGTYSSGIRHHIGPMYNDTMIGSWTFFHRSGQMASQEEYQADTLVRAICYNEQGDIQGGTCMPEVEAVYAKGMPAWTGYVRKRMESNMRLLRDKRADGSVMVQFVIDTLGKVTDVTLVKKANNFLDEFALKLVQESGDWIPARQHNIAVKAYRRQPIVFYLE